MSPPRGYGTERQASTRTLQVEGWKRIVDGVPQYAKAVVCTLNCGIPGRFSPHIPHGGSSLPVSASVDPEYWENPSRLAHIDAARLDTAFRLIGAIETSEIPNCVFELLLSELSNTHEQPDSMASRFMRVTAYFILDQPVFAGWQQ